MNTTIPAGMIQVDKGEFFARLEADKRDIMPNHAHPDSTTWETTSREVWGWTLPGWKNPGDPKVYAVKSWK